MTFPSREPRFLPLIFAAAGFWLTLASSWSNLIVNGDFTNGLANWTWAGNVSSSSGISLAKDSATRSVIFQTVQQENLPLNLSLEFYYGVLSDVVPPGTFADTAYFSIYESTNAVTLRPDLDQFDAVSPVFDATFGGFTNLATGVTIQASSRGPNWWTVSLTNYVATRAYIAPTLEIFNFNGIANDSTGPMTAVTLNSVPESRTVVLLCCALLLAVALRIVRSRGALIAFLALIAAGPLLHAQNAEALGSRARVSTTNETSAFDRATRLITQTADVTVTNAGDRPIKAPLRVRIALTGDGDLSRVVLSGVQPGGEGDARAFYDLSSLLPPGGLAPNSSLKFQLRLTRPSTVAVAYQLEAQGAFNRDPSAVFDAPLAAVAGEEVAFDASASDDGDGGKEIAFAWNFGDGGTSSAAAPKRTFAKPGRYDVALTVTDGENARTVLRKTITVLPSASFAVARTRTLDASGQPLGGVSVRQRAGTEVTESTSDAATGFTALGGDPGDYIWRFSREGYLPAWRKASLSARQILFVPSPWLVRENAKDKPVSPLRELVLGGTNEPATISFAAGSFAAEGFAGFTPIGPQALPLPLPAGWSPLGAFCLALSAAPSQAGNVTWAPSDKLGSDDALAMLKYDTELLQWKVLSFPTPGAAPASAVNESGTYALVVADKGARAPPSAQVGAALPAATDITVDSSAITATGSIDPSKITASREAASMTTAGRVVFTGASDLPSGTYFRTEIEETYNLANGRTQRTPVYDTSFFAYQRPGDTDAKTLHAAFPLRPTRLISPEQIDTAKIEADILTGDSYAASLFDQTGGRIAAENLAVSAEAGDLSGRSLAELRLLDTKGFEVPLAGRAGVSAFQLAVGNLAKDRGLNVELSGLAPNKDFVVARYVAKDDEEGLEPVERLRSNSNGNATSVEPAEGVRLPGVTGSGQYVVVAVDGPQAVVSGVARNLAGDAVAGLAVRISGLPWLTFSASGGAYKLVAPQGVKSTVALTDPADGNSGSAEVDIAAGALSATANVRAAVTAPRVANVFPADGAQKVRAATPVKIRFSEPIDPATFGPDAMTLTNPLGVLIQGSLSLNPAGTEATFLPTNPLEHAATYTIELSAGIKDRQGLALTGPRLFSFAVIPFFERAQGAQLVIYEPGAKNIPQNVRSMLVGYSSAEGSSHVVAHGSAGTADPEVPVILVNQNTGETATVLSKPDGSFANFVNAAEEDFIEAVFVNANGTRVTVPATKQIYDNGRIGLYKYGGILEAESDGGPVQIQIEPQAIKERTVFKVDLLSVQKLAELTGGVLPEGEAKALPGVNVSVDQGDVPVGDAEISFPLDPSTLGLDPNVDPESAAFALTIPLKVDGEVVYVTVDKMRYENGRLFTNTCPFKGMYGPPIWNNNVNLRGNTYETAYRAFEQLRVGSDLLQKSLDLIPTLISKQYKGSTVNGTVAQLPFDDIEKIGLAEIAELARLPLRVFTGQMFGPADLVGTLSQLVVDGMVDKAIPVQGALVALRSKNQTYDGRIRPGMVSAISDENGCYSLVGPQFTGNLVATHPRFGRARDVGIALFDRSELGSGFQPFVARNIFFGVPDEDFRRIKPSLVVSHDPPSPALGEVATLRVDAFTAPNVSAEIRIGKPSLRTLVLGQAVAAKDLEVVEAPQSEVVAPGHVRTTVKYRAFKGLLASVNIRARGSTAKGDVSTVEQDYEVAFGFSRPSITNPLPVADPADKEPPEVVSVFPRAGEMLAAGQAVQVVFSEPIDKASLQAPDAANFARQSGAPGLSLSADQRVLTIARRDSSTLGGLVTLTLGAGIRDLSGNILSPAKSFDFETVSPQVHSLNGIDVGGGSVIDDSYCYVLDRGSPGRVRVFDVSDPSAPQQVGDFSALDAAAAQGSRRAIMSALDFPRDLALIRDWSHVPGLDGQFQPLPATRRKLLAVVGGLAGTGVTNEGNNVLRAQYLTILDVSDPAKPTLVQNVEVTLRYSVLQKLVWRAPYLYYLENSADSHFVGSIDLQELLLGFSLASVQRLPVFGSGRDGKDVNNDGDYTDGELGEKLPYPDVESNTEFMGFRGAYDARPFPQQRIEDFALDNRGNLAVVRSLSGISPPIPSSAAAEFRLLSANGRAVPSQAGFLALPGARPKRLTLAPSTKLLDGRERNLAFVSLSPDADGLQKIAVIDYTDAAKPTMLASMPIPAQLQLGVLQSPVLGPDGLLRISTTTNVLLVDPARVALPPPAGANDLHPAIIGILPGGSGNFSIGVNDAGLRSVALGGRNEIVMAPPTLSFVQFPTAASVVVPKDLATMGAPGRQEILAKMRTTASLRPARYRTASGIGSTLLPPSALHHYHVLVRAPGGSGPTIPLLLESLNEAGAPLRAKGKNFPPVRAAESAANTKPDGTPTDVDADVPRLNAYRVSHDKSDPGYNLYLSDPIAVVREGISSAELRALGSNPERAILWSECGVRASIDYGATGPLAAFASGFDDLASVYRPKTSVIASTLPGGFIPGSTPPPIGGEFAVPGTFGTIDAVSGEFRYSTVDLQMPSPRMDVVLERKAASHALVDSGFGRGWDFNYNQRLIELTPDLVPGGEEIPITERKGDKDVIAESLDIMFSDGAGNSVLFEHKGKAAPPGVDNDPLVDLLGWKTAGGEFYLPASTQPGVFDLIYRYPDGQKVRLTPDGTLFLYRADGRLAKIVDRYPANNQVMEYDAAGNLIAVVDKSVDSHRKLRFGYFRAPSDPDYHSDVDQVVSDDAGKKKLGRICSLTDFAERRIDFEYNNDGMLVRRLGVQVSGANGGFSGRSKTEYLIDSRTKSYVGVTTGTGAQQGGTPMVAAKTIPNANGEAVAESTDGAGGKTEIDVPLGRTASNVDAAPTDVGHGDGSTTSISFDANGYPAGATFGGGGNAAPAAAYQTDYNAIGLPDKVTYPEGNSIIYTYEPNSAPFRSRANVIKVVRDPGPRGGPTITTEAKYDHTFNELSGQQKDANGKTSTITLNGDKRHAVQIDYSSAGTLTVARDANGRILSQTSPEGIAVAYEYDRSSGYLTKETRGGSLDTRYSYDSSPAGRLGLPTTITRPRGASTSIIYDAKLKPTSMTRGSLVVKNGYDENGNVTFISRSLGDTVDYEQQRVYSQLNFLEKVTINRVETGGGAQNLVTTFTPDALFRIKEMKLPKGEVRKISYNQRGHISKMEIGTYVEEYAHDLHGNVTAVKRGRDEVQSSTYDGHDRPLVVQALDGSGTNKTTRAYFDGGQLKSLKIEGPTGGVVKELNVTDVDELGRPLRINLVGTTTNASIAFSYQGTKTVQAGPVDTVTTETDAAGRVSKSSDALRSVTFTLDGNGNVKRTSSVEDGETYTRDMEYDDLDNLKKVSDSEGTIAEITSMRTDGLPLAVKDGRNKTINRSYSRLGELLAVEKPEQLKFVYAFDENRQPVKVADRGDKGNVTAYDTTLRPTSVTWRDGSSTTFSDFDGRNRPKTITIPDGAIIATYDLQGRPTKLDTTFSGGNYQFKDATYDALGRLRSAKYGADGGNSVSYGYDKLGPLTSVSYDEPGGPFTVSAGIRSDGARTSLTYPSGVTVNESRDNGGRLTKVDIGGTAIWEVSSFAGVELPAVVKRGASITEKCSYDDRKRLLSRRFTGAGGALLEDVRVAYDGANNVIARQLLVGGGRTDLFEYDDANRLTKAEYGARPGTASVRSGTGLIGGQGLSAGVYARDFAYDTGGLDLLSSATVINPDKVPLQASTPLPLHLPSLAEALGGHDNFLFATSVDGFSRSTDALGNTARTQLTVRPASGLPQRLSADLTYNGKSNLVRITRSDGVTIDMQYRPDNTMHHRKVTGGANPSDTALVWHEGRLLEEYDLSSGSAVLQARYYYADGDTPVAADLRQAGGALLRVHYLHDHLSSVVAVANDAGEVIERVRYDAWGQPVILARDTASASISQIRQDGNTILVTMSEPVLPVPDQGAGADLVTSVPGTLADAFEMIVNGDKLQPQVVFEEGLKPFGSVFRLSGFPANTVGAMTVRVVGNKLVDTFGNFVAETSMPFGLSPVPAVGVPFGSTCSVVSRSAIGNPWLWQGQWFDYDAGLIYMRARHYDPQTGHFLQRDPMQYEDSVNLYAAMANNPASYRDPTGRLPVLAIAGAVFVGGLFTSAVELGDEHATEASVGNAFFGGAVAGGAGALAGVAAVGAGLTAGTVVAVEAVTGAGANILGGVATRGLDQLGHTREQPKDIVGPEMLVDGGTGLFGPFLGRAFAALGSKIFASGRSFLTRVAAGRAAREAANEVTQVASVVASKNAAPLALPPVVGRKSVSGVNLFNDALDSAGKAIDPIYKHFENPKIRDVDSGFFDVGAHSDKNGILQFKDGPNSYTYFDHETVAEKMLAAGYIPGNPIRILACEAGACTSPNGIGAYLSKRFKATVIAPTETLAFSPNNAAKMRPPLEMRNKANNPHPDANWALFMDGLWIENLQ